MRVQNLIEERFFWGTFERGLFYKFFLLLLLFLIVFIYTLLDFFFNLNWVFSVLALLLYYDNLLSFFFWYQNIWSTERTLKTNSFLLFYLIIRNFTHFILTDYLY